MPYDRDVRAFDERAASYEAGMLGQLHRDISGQVADLALSLGPAPRRVLDVGSGTGYLLGLLARRLPGAQELAGVDPAPAMVTVASERAVAPRPRGHHPGGDRRQVALSGAAFPRSRCAGQDGGDGHAAGCTPAPAVFS